MVRFVLGVAIGALAMYWYLTGKVPWRREIEGWFSSAASSYSSEAHQREADDVLTR
jgi:hypothetical protein